MSNVKWKEQANGLLNKESACCVFRTVLLAAFAFAWGSPQFADLRPGPLDVPLVNFHHEVKAVARDAVYAVQSVDAVRDLEFMDTYFNLVMDRLNG